MNVSNNAELPPEVREYLRAKGERLGKEHGARGGKATAQRLKPAQRRRNAKKAGEASAASLTPEERSERARKAAEESWRQRRARAAEKEKEKEKQ